MTFGEGIKKLQEQNPEYLILAENGIFYNAVGMDAIFLEQEYNLTKICFGTEVCKCGISTKKITEFIPKLKVKYIVYKYIKGRNLSIEEQFIEIARKDSGESFDRKLFKLDCDECEYKKSIEKTTNHK